MYSSLMHYVSISVVYRILRPKSAITNIVPGLKKPISHTVVLFLKLNEKGNFHRVLPHILQQKQILQLIKAFDHPSPSSQISRPAMNSSPCPLADTCVSFYTFLFAHSTLFSLHTYKTQTSLTVQDDQ